MSLSLTRLTWIALAAAVTLALALALLATSAPAAAQPGGDPTGEVTGGSEPVPTTHAPTPNDPVVCSLGSDRSNRPFATYDQYGPLRAALLDTANFGPGGIVPETVTIRAGVSTIDGVAVAGCDVFWASGMFSIDPAEVSTLVSAVLNGMVLIIDADFASPFVAPQNAILNALDGSSSSEGSACPNASAGGAISSADNPATNGPFGDVRNGTFATSFSSLVSPAAGDHAVVTCGASTVRMVIPPGKLGSGSGLVMAGGDPSALDIFLPGGSLSNPNNETLYLNAFASSVATNAPPDCSGATATPNSLWPPSGKFRTVTVAGVTDPDGDPVAITIIGVTQDEPVSGLADGNTSPDAASGATSTQVRLRAERRGSGDGRIYTIAVRATDGKSGTCTGTALVGVAHQASGPAVNSAPPSYDSFGI
jgi:hypothetical protein